MHQTLTMFDSIVAIENAKSGEIDHRANVERSARKMRMANG